MEFRADRTVVHCSALQFDYFQIARLVKIAEKAYFDDLKSCQEVSRILYHSCKCSYVKVWKIKKGVIHIELG